MVKKADKPKATNIPTYPAGEFVNMIHQQAKRRGAEFAFFLGSGCSVTSGIPDARSLTHEWLQILKDRKNAKDENLHVWAAKEFSGYTEHNAAKYFAEVMKTVFNTADQRQHEIETLTESRSGMPLIGYAKLAQLIALKEHKGQFTTVLTTNFDDMVADALYLYTHTKPRVITHEILAEYAPVQSKRPLVFKIHGDALLYPQTKPEEIDHLEQKTNEKLLDLIKEKTLIFIGYGGHDESIAKLLSKLGPRQPKGGIYWVGKEIPDNCVGKVLKAKGDEVFHVNISDFDELMVLFDHAFKLGKPEGIPHEKLMDTYQKDFQRLSTKLKTSPETEASTPLKDALDTIENSLIEENDWFSIYLKAEEQLPDNPEIADKIYKEGLEKIGENPNLLNYYAIFLKNVRNDMDRAEDLYQRALKINPNHANVLSSYALFLRTVSKDMDQAEDHYQRAFNSDPRNVFNLGRYANFLYTVRKDSIWARDLLQRALKLDPYNVFVLCIYMEFLFWGGKNVEGWHTLEVIILRHDREKSLLLGAHTVAYALSPGAAEQERALRVIQRLLFNGERRAIWRFDDVLAKAEEFGYVDMTFAQALAEVVNDKAKITTLDTFPEWKALK